MLDTPSGIMPASFHRASELHITPDRQRSFTELLISRRKAMGKRQEDIAAEAGVNQAQISKLERAFYGGMRAADFLRVLAAYRVDPNEAAAALGLMSDTAPHPEPVLESIATAMVALENMDTDKAEKALEMIQVILRGLQD